jgi:hypothetical protein
MPEGQPGHSQRKRSLNVALSNRKATCRVGMTCICAGKLGLLSTDRVICGRSPPHAGPMVAPALSVSCAAGKLLRDAPDGSAPGSDRGGNLANAPGGGAAAARPAPDAGEGDSRIQAPHARPGGSKRQSYSPTYLHDSHDTAAGHPPVACSHSPPARRPAATLRPSAPRPAAAAPGTGEAAHPTTRRPSATAARRASTAVSDKDSACPSPPAPTRPRAPDISA